MVSRQFYPILTLATLLWCISILYSGAVRLRRKLYYQGVLPSYQLPCPVVSVGNLTVGGTGKTPMVIHLANLVERAGYRVVVISRGYKGRAQKRGAIVTDGRTLLCDVQQSGDEPYLMATLLESVPVIVGKDRYKAGKIAIEQFKPDVILLDDAFQHLRLHRDLNLLLLDARSPFGNAFLLPRGRLREPVSAMSHADAIIVTRSDRPALVSLKDIVDSDRSGPILFCSVHRSVLRGVLPAGRAIAPLHQLSRTVSSLKGTKAFGFAGLADNQSFFDTIHQWGGHVNGTMEFEDHYAYDKNDVIRINRDAVKAGADALVTTDKDYVRLAGEVPFTLDLIVLGVELDIVEGDVDWKQFVVERLEAVIRQRKAS